MNTKKSKSTLFKRLTEITTEKVNSKRLKSVHAPLTQYWDISSKKINNNTNQEEINNDNDTNDDNEYSDNDQKHCVETDEYQQCNDDIITTSRYNNRQKILMDFLNWEHITRDGREMILPFYLFRECHYRDWYKYVPIKISKYLTCSKLTCWRKRIMLDDRYVDDISKYHIQNKLEPDKLTRAQMKAMMLCNSINIILLDSGRPNVKNQNNLSNSVDLWEVDMEKLIKLNSENMSIEFVFKCITLSLYYFVLFFSENLTHINIKIYIQDYKYYNFFENQLESIIKEFIKSVSTFHN